MGREESVVHFAGPAEIRGAGVGRRSTRVGVLVDAHDLLFIFLTIVVFVFLALCARAAEKL